MILANITQNVQTALNPSLEVFSIFPIIDTIADGALDRNDNGIRLQFLQYAFVLYWRIESFCLFCLRFIFFQILE